MEKLIKKYLRLEEKGKKAQDKADEIYKEANKIEEELERFVARQRKIPKRVSCTVGKYRLSLPIRYGCNLRIKEKR